jgi:hypothetical protein
VNAGGRNERRPPPNSLQETRLLEVIAAQRTEVIAGLPLAAVWSGYGRKPAAQVRRSASLLMTHRGLPVG